jgi:hypothetical protein
MQAALYILRRAMNKKNLNEVLSAFECLERSGVFPLLEFEFRFELHARFGQSRDRSPFRLPNRQGPAVVLIGRISREFFHVCAKSDMLVLVEYCFFVDL